MDINDGVCNIDYLNGNLLQGSEVIVIPTGITTVLIKKRGLFGKVTNTYKNIEIKPGKWYKSMDNLCFFHVNSISKNSADNWDINVDKHGGSYIDRDILLSLDEFLANIGYDPNSIDIDGIHYENKLKVNFGYIEHSDINVSDRIDIKMYYNGNAVDVYENCTVTGISVSDRDTYNPIYLTVKTEFNCFRIFRFNNENKHCDSRGNIISIIRIAKRN